MLEIFLFESINNFESLASFIIDLAIELESQCCLLFQILSFSILRLMLCCLGPSLLSLLQHIHLHALFSSFAIKCFESIYAEQCCSSMCLWRLLSLGVFSV